MPLDACLRLERSRDVVDARVQNTTIVAGLLARDGGVFFDDDEAQAGLAQQKLTCGRQPYDSCADNRDVILAPLGHGLRRECRRRCHMTVVDVLHLCDLRIRWRLRGSLRESYRIQPGIESARHAMRQDAGACPTSSVRPHTSDGNQTARSAHPCLYWRSPRGAMNRRWLPSPSARHTIQDMKQDQIIEKGPYMDKQSTDDQDSGVCATGADYSLPHSPGVYQIICVANGKIYIGSAINLRRRWEQHRRLLRGETP